MIRTFEHILDEASVLLRRRGRLTFGALKRQLDLDDAYFADLKEELVRGQRLATEDHGVLVWTGDPTPERRHLTVMFCDVVGSTALSERLDPEDLRDVIRDYQTACEDPIRRFDGYVTQYLGDGILSYFGYPRAHDDDARRAVRAGLAILDALRVLNDRLERDKRIRVGVRVGIHTGLVVVGEVGSGERRGEIAFGEAPNVAARVQSLADPDSVAVSAATHRLVADAFRFVDRGPHSLRGLGERMNLYRVLEERASVRIPRYTPIVGRERELDVLQAEWDAAKQGEGRVVLVVGEAGIGKSLLVGAVRERAEADGAATIDLDCSPYFSYSALYPLAVHLGRELALDAEPTADAKLERLRRFVDGVDGDRDAVPYFASLLRVAVASSAATPQAKQAAHRALVEHLLRAGAHRPALLVFEDLHWADPSTHDVLSQLCERIASASILCICTTRPDGEPAWCDRPHVTRVAPAKLARDEVEAIALVVAGGRPLPPEVLREIGAKTDGNPLFVEEITKAILESSLLREQGDRFVLARAQTSVGIPVTLTSSLMARIDRLAGVKRIAQLAAAIGRKFSYELLAATADLDEPDLRRSLERLVTAGIVLAPRGGDRAYQFKHALIRDVAYESILLSTKQAIHERIADALGTRLRALGEDEPELVAYHLTQAGFAERAIRHWQTAGVRAAERSDYAEAGAHLTSGLSLVERLPDGAPRDRAELDLQIPRAGALRATKGFAAPETGDAYARARELCRRLNDSPRLIPTLNGLYSFHLVRGEYTLAGETAAELLAMAQRERNATYEMIGDRAIGAVDFHVGRLLSARDSLQRALAAYDVEKHKSLAYTYGTDHAMATSCFLSLTDWALGDAEKARAQQSWAIAHSERLGHQHSVAQALTFMCMMHMIDGDEAAMMPLAERLLELSTHHWFVLMSASARFWLAAARGTVEEMRRAAAAWWATGAVGYRPLVLVRIARACGEAGAIDEGLAMVEEATARTEESGERWTEPELLRVKAELCARSTRREDREAARACAERAFEIARAQGAHAWDARIARTLAAL